MLLLVSKFRSILIIGGRRRTKHFKRFLNTYNLECGTLYEKNFSCYNIWPQATLKPGCKLVYMAATKFRITKDLRNRWSLVTEWHTGRKASDTLLQRYQDLQLPGKWRKKNKNVFSFGEEIPLRWRELLIFLIVFKYSLCHTVSVLFTVLQFRLRIAFGHTFPENFIYFWRLQLLSTNTILQFLITRGNLIFNSVCFFLMRR